ncbi:MAG: DUF3798 domain-containing protein [Oscillospiraceae bacterium]|nr:DUF3798 domain-containing protein [Oscillospiraceae bacterium]
MRSIQRAFALIAALALLAAVFSSCGGEAKLKSAPGKILIFTGNEDFAPVELARARALSKEYEPGTISIQPLDERYVNDGTAFYELAKQVIPQIQGLHGVVFAQGVKGTAQVAMYLDANYPSVRVAVCLPEETPSVFVRSADLVLDIDGAALGRAMVAESRRMGAETFYFLTCPRQERQPGQKALREAVEAQCAEEGIPFKYHMGRDTLVEGRESAVEYCETQAAAWTRDAGDKITAWYATDRGVNTALAVKALLDGKAILPGLSDFTPLAAFPAALGANVEGFETDAPYVMERIGEAAGDLDKASQIALWQASLPSVMLTAAVDFVVNNQKARTINSDANAALDDAVKRNGKLRVTMTRDEVNRNVYLVSCELKALG